MSQGKIGKKDIPLAAIRRSSKASVNSDSSSTSSSKQKPHDNKDEPQNGINKSTDEPKQLEPAESNERIKTPKPASNGNADSTSISEAVELEQPPAANGQEKLTIDLTNESENNDEVLQQIENISDANSDIIPPLLLLETDEIEPELESISIESPSDHESDRSKFNASPILSRSETRRSQVRNVPTPKTPKLLISNGNDDSIEPDIEECKTDEKLSQRISVALTKLKNRDSDESPEVDVTSPAYTVNESVLVNYSGDNTTRNIDFTTRDESYSLRENSSDDSSSFANQTKDLSFVKAMRVISGRKNVQDLRQASFRNAQKYIMEKSAGVETSFDSRGKRKYENFALSEYDSPKRMRSAEDSSGILSYVSSPLDNLRKKFARTQVTSTPIQSATTSTLYEKSLGYKYGSDVAAAEEPKKWCSIQ